MPTIEKNAILSDCRAYRYLLSRAWDPTRGIVAFIGLNPSTADESEDDPTIRRCVAFAREWGFGGLVMANLFAFRATDPAVMMAARDPVGPENDAHLGMVSENCDLVVAAWGNGGAHLGRGEQVRAMLSEPHCLTVTGQGQPGHPLYLKKSLTPIRWKASP